MDDEKLEEIYEKYIAYLENNPSVKVHDLSIREVVNQYGLGPFTQYLKIEEIRPLEDYKLWCRLITGETMIYDFTPQLEWPLFAHLKDKAKFDEVGLGSSGVPTWVNPFTGDNDLELGISYILLYGIDISS